MSEEEINVNDETAPEEVIKQTGETVATDEGELVELMRVSMNGETFLLPVQDVGEILRPIALTPVPMAPDHMLGLANIRGQIVCIIDPGKVLHLKQGRGAESETTRYLILRHPRMHLGMWVDEVSQLYRVSKNSLPAVDSEDHTHVRGEIGIEGESFKLLDTSVLFD